MEMYVRRVNFGNTECVLDENRKVNIGRDVSRGNDIVCPGVQVSRSHCELTFIDHSWHITDLKSMNGVFVNGAKIPACIPTKIKVGDILGIGAFDRNSEDYFIFEVKARAVPLDTIVLKSEDQEVETENVASGESCSAAEAAEVPAFVNSANQLQQDLPAVKAAEGPAVSPLSGIVCCDEQLGEVAVSEMESAPPSPVFGGRAEQQLQGASGAGAEDKSAFVPPRKGADKQGTNGSNAEAKVSRYSQLQCETFDEAEGRSAFIPPREGGDQQRKNGLNPEANVSRYFHLPNGGTDKRRESETAVKVEEGKDSAPTNGDVVQQQKIGIVPKNAEDSAGVNQYRKNGVKGTSVFKSSHFPSSNRQQMDETREATDKKLSARSCVGDGRLQRDEPGKPKGGKSSSKKIAHHDARKGSNKGKAPVEHHSSSNDHCYKLKECTVKVRKLNIRVGERVKVGSNGFVMPKKKRNKWRGRNVLTSDNESSDAEDQHSNGDQRDGDSPTFPPFIPKKEKGLDSPIKGKGKTPAGNYCGVGRNDAPKKIDAGPSTVVSKEGLEIIGIGVVCPIPVEAHISNPSKDFVSEGARGSDFVRPERFSYSQDFDDDIECIEEFLPPREESPVDHTNACDDGVICIVLDSDEEFESSQPCERGVGDKLPLARQQESELRHSDDEPVASTSRDSSHESRARKGDEIAGPSKRKFRSSLVPVDMFQTMIDKDDESEESSDTADEATFWPQLSQSFLNEIEGDDVDEVPARQLEVKREEPRQESRSNALSRQEIFKKQKMKTKVIEPKAIDPSLHVHHGKRFKLTTGSSPPRNTSRHRSPERGRGSPPPGLSEFKRKAMMEKAKRVMRKSPPKRKRKGKDVNSIGKLKDKMKKDFHMDGVPRALKAKPTQSKPDIAVVSTVGRGHSSKTAEKHASSAPAKASIPVRANGKVSGSQKGKSIKAASVEKAVDPGERVHSARTTPEDKVVSAAPKGKTKFTESSRSAKLFEEFTNPTKPDCADPRKRQMTTMHMERIPKKPKTDTPAEKNYSVAVLTSPPPPVGSIRRARIDPPPKNNSSNVQPYFLDAYLPVERDKVITQGLQKNAGDLKVDLPLKDKNVNVGENNPQKKRISFATVLEQVRSIPSRANVEHGPSVEVSQNLQPLPVQYREVNDGQVDRSVGQSSAWHHSNVRTPGEAPRQVTGDAQMEHPVNSRDPRIRNRISAQNPLRDDMLVRILKWSFNWIKEQEQVLDSEPPPLLQEVRDGKNLRTIPCLDSLPVLTTYNCIESYFQVYQPLMLFELWASISKDVDEGSKNEDSRVFFCTVKHETPGILFTTLNCPVIILEGSERPREYDLCKFSRTDRRTGTKGYAFGIITSVMNNWNRMDSSHIHKLGKRFAECAKIKKRFFYGEVNVMVASTRPPDRESLIELVKLSSIKSFVRQLEVHSLLAESPIARFVLDPPPAVFQPGTIAYDDLPELNETQNAAVASAVGMMILPAVDDPKIALLQGPPGTGKSHVIVSMIFSTLKHYRNINGHHPFILVCAPSNAAVDEIALRVIKKLHTLDEEERFEIVRIGVPNSMHKDVRNYSLDCLANRRRLNGDHVYLNLRTEIAKVMQQKVDIRSKIRQFQREQDEARRLSRQLEELEESLSSLEEAIKRRVENQQTSVRDRTEILVKSSVVFSTLNSCISNPMREAFSSGKRRFLCCIIDEASQCTEPESLSPLVFGINKFILVGDPEQLPATVCSNEAKKNEFHKSFFNRLFKHANTIDVRNFNGTKPVMMLNVQYRMEPEICRWPSKYFYGNRLTSDSSTQRGSPFYPYKVFNVIDSEELCYGKDLSNPKEALFVAKLVDCILSSNRLGNKTIGVITFYRKQKMEIENKIRERCSRFNREVDVNTVDGFQGQEKDIIVVSCVRAKSTTGTIGHAASLQRLNVALTRGRDGVFVCGHFESLKANEGWKELINDASDREVTHLVTSGHVNNLLSNLLIRRDVLASGV